MDCIYKNLILLCCAVSLSSSPAKAQKFTGPSDVFTSVEIAPNFPGGMQKFYEFLGHTVKYPYIDRKKSIEGRVIIAFIIEKDGSLSNVKSLHAPSITLANEAVRAVKASPKWNPGLQEGRKVRVQYVVPIAFTLEDEKPKKSSSATEKR